MQIIEKTSRYTYRFFCKACGVLLEAEGNEFEFYKPGVLKCTCLACKEKIAVNERDIRLIDKYVPATKR